MFWRKVGWMVGMAGALWIWIGPKGWVDPGTCYGASDKGTGGLSYFITEWLVVGPFPDEWGEDYIDFLGGEATIEPVEGRAHLSEVGKEGEAIWKKHTTGENGFVDFQNLYGSGYGISAYAFAYIERDQDRRTLLELRARGSSQIWLNHRLIHIEQRTKAYPRLGNRLIYAELKPGRNPLLVKLPGSGKPWGFALKVREVTDRLVVDTANQLLPDLRNLATQPRNRAGADPPFLVR